MFSTACLAAITILAQDAPPPGDAPGFLQLAMPFALIALLYYTMFVLPQKTQKNRIEDLASNLKVNDHVVTGSGMYGVVTNVQRDENRVTLRVDETTGAKIRVTIESIGRVLNDHSKSADADKNSSTSGKK